MNYDSFNPNNYNTKNMKKNYLLYVLLFSSALLITGCDDDDYNSSPDPIIVPSIFDESEPINSIPLPPDGQRWVLNEQFSDEFNGSQLDESKWVTPHPTWIGRAPGLFEKERVSFKDGCMVLEGIKMEEPKIVNGTEFNISCAAVVSKEQKAHYGYYECRFKANKTTLSSTFWMSTRTGTFPVEGKQPEGSAPGRFSQELDICETIGRTGDFSGKYFYEGMNSNVHYWFDPADGSERQDIRAEESKLSLPDGKVPSDDFNTYGCWWHDKSSATFYLNNKPGKTIQFKNRNTNAPFYLTEPMGINMVVETYPTPWIELPNDEELADDSKNKTYYDWIRSYILKDLNEEYPEHTVEKVFGYKVNLNNKHAVMFYKENNKYNFSFTYASDKNCKVVFALYDVNKNEITRQSYNLYAGYAKINLSDTEAIMYVDNIYYAVAYILPAASDDLNSAYERDSYGFKCIK